MVMTLGQIYVVIKVDLLLINLNKVIAIEFVLSTDIL